MFTTIKERQRLGWRHLKIIQNPEAFTVGCFREEGIAKLIKENGANTGIELGVRTGEFSKHLWYSGLGNMHGVDIVDVPEGRLLEKQCYG